MNTYYINLPFKSEDIAKFKSGDMLYLSGTIYTARDAAHKRLFDEGLIDTLNLNNKIIYYVGPTPSFGDNIIGSAGPTTSSRMDIFTPKLMQSGIVATIGKGDRDDTVKAACIENKGLYLITTGGVGALLSKCIKSIEVIMFDDLGCESIKKLEVENFPVYVAYDIYGGDIYNKKKRTT